MGKNIQAAAYNGARTVNKIGLHIFYLKSWIYLNFEHAMHCLPLFIVYPLFLWRHIIYQTLCDFSPTKKVHISRPFLLLGGPYPIMQSIIRTLQIVHVQNS